MPGRAWTATVVVLALAPLAMLLTLPSCRGQRINAAAGITSDTWRLVGVCVDPEIPDQERPLVRAMQLLHEAGIKWRGVLNLGSIFISVRAQDYARVSALLCGDKELGGWGCPVRPSDSTEDFPK